MKAPTYYYRQSATGYERWLRIGYGAWSVTWTRRVPAAVRLLKLGPGSFARYERGRAERVPFWEQPWL